MLHVLAVTAVRNQAETVTAAEPRTGAPLTRIVPAAVCAAVMSPAAAEVSCRLLVPAWACAAVWTMAQFVTAAHVAMFVSNVDAVPVRKLASVAPVPPAPPALVLAVTPFPPCPVVASFAPNQGPCRSTAPVPDWVYRSRTPTCEWC